MAEEWGQKNQSVFRLHPSSFTLGPYTGDQLSVDHIIPYAVAPQLDSRAASESRETDHALHDPQGDTSVRREGVNVIANLELMPLRMNIGKRDRMTTRQHALAARLRRAGLF